MMWRSRRVSAAWSMADMCYVRNTSARKITVPGPAVNCLPRSARYIRVIRGLPPVIVAKSAASAFKSPVIRGYNARMLNRRDFIAKTARRHPPDWLRRSRSAPTRSGARTTRATSRSSDCAVSIPGIRRGPAGAVAWTITRRCRRSQMSASDSTGISSVTSGVREFCRSTTAQSIVVIGRLYDPMSSTLR